MSDLEFWQQVYLLALPKAYEVYVSHAHNGVKISMSDITSYAAQFADQSMSEMIRRKKEDD